MVLAEDVIRKSIAELVGTFILVLVGTGAAVAGKPTDFAFGFALIAIVYAIGKISGAHVNPAVTLGLALSGRLPMEQVPFYWGSQAIGAILASVVVRVVYGNEANLAANAVADGFSLLDGFLIELVATAIFVFVVVAVATDDRTPAAATGVAIGFALTAVLMLAGAVTGGSVNPARSLGPALVSGTFSDLWIFLTAPLIGGAIGALLYEFLRGPEGAGALQRALTQRRAPADPGAGRRPSQRRQPAPADAQQPAPRQQRRPAPPRQPVYEEEVLVEEVFYDDEPLPAPRPPQQPQQRAPQQPQQRAPVDPNAPQRPQQRRRPPQ